MPKVTSTRFRETLSETINRVAYGRERVVLHRRGKKLVAIVPVEDLEALEALEDRIDLELAAKARKERGRISWDTAKKRLNLK